MFVVRLMNIIDQNGIERIEIDLHSIASVGQGAHSNLIYSMNIRLRPYLVHEVKTVLYFVFPFAEFSKLLSFYKKYLK